MEVLQDNDTSTELDKRHLVDSVDSSPVSICIVHNPGSGDLTTNWKSCPECLKQMGLKIPDNAKCNLIFWEAWGDNGAGKNWKDLLPRGTFNFPGNY